MRVNTCLGYDNNLIRPKNSELLNDVGAEKAIAIQLIKENPEISFEEALKYGKDFIKNGSCIKINAEVNNKIFHFSGGNKFRFPGFSEDCF